MNDVIKQLKRSLKYLTCNERMYTVYESTVYKTAAL